VFNFDGKVGAVGRVPKYLRNTLQVRLIKHDPDTGEVMRGLDGLAVEARVGEIGEFVGKIGTSARESYTGYVDKSASKKKVLEDVFARGDQWFSTGDLMRQDADGYFYFVDRIGDTFRWKGENVSTGEVAAVLGMAPGVAEANVYGVEVPGADGRAGMATLAVQDGFDLATLEQTIDASLPAYARPIFLRVGREIATTGTFKYTKTALVEQGFDPGATSDPTYFREPGGHFVPLDPAIHAKLRAGEIRL
jgi:fatty-acyl-CoA synthase